MEENGLVFWIQFIQHRCPGSKVLFVGSFMDCIAEAERKNHLEKISRSIEQLLSVILSNQAMPLKVQRYQERVLFWPVDCTTGTGVHDLWITIGELALHSSHVVSEELLEFSKLI